jgi:hypothetical protein
VGGGGGGGVTNPALEIQVAKKAVKFLTDECLLASLEVFVCMELDNKRYKCDLQIAVIGSVHIASAVICCSSVYEGMKSVSTGNVIFSDTSEVGTQLQFLSCLYFCGFQPP